MLYHYVAISTDNENQDKDPTFFSVQALQLFSNAIC